MSMPDHKRRKSPVDRFRSILSDGQKNDERIENRENRKSPVVNLPKIKPTDVSPAPGSSAPPQAVSQTIYQTDSPNQNNHFLPTFWTVASIISLTVNAFLIILMVIVLR